MEKKVNIIVPFISLNDYALECISHVLELRYKNFQLILLPDIPIKPPKHLNKHKKIKIIVTGKKNISAKRNIGIAAAQRSDYFAFIDSDAYPYKDWLKNALPYFQAGKNIWAVGGPNITPPGEPLRKKVVGNASKSMLISGTFSFRKRVTKSRFCTNLPTCNLIISKEAVNSVGNFNENLMTGEDIDYCTRIIQKNKKIYYAKDVVVYHHNRALPAPFLKQRITWGLSVFKVMAENPSLSNLFLFLPMGFLLFIAALSIMSFFNGIFFLILVLVLSIYFFSILSESVRWSRKFVEIPGTFIAILLGNLAPGVGSLWALFRINKDDKALVRKIYRNF